MKGTGLRLSVTLLTVIPWREAQTAEPMTEAGTGGGNPAPAALPPGTVAAAMAWAPAVGLLLGVIASGVLVVADHPLGAGPLTAAGLAVGLLALLSRGLHLDGLADLADGLASGKAAPAALDIMRRSDIGPLGTVTLILTLLIQVAALGQAESAGHGRGPAALIAAVVTGRLALTWACRRGVPAARPDGLGALVAESVRPATAAAATVGTVAAATARGRDLRHRRRRATGLDPPARDRRGPGRGVRPAAACGAAARRHHRRCAGRAGRDRHHRRPGGGGHGTGGLTRGRPPGSGLSAAGHARTH